uniref:GMIP/FCHO2-like FCH domain-containing protein n=1 Tax=Gopherus evgoodei TaxID=1825980 RepID=A0A8C4WIS9_9SAUR
AVGSGRERCPAQLQDVLFWGAFLGREAPGLRRAVPQHEAGGRSPPRSCCRLHPREGHHGGDLWQVHGQDGQDGHQCTQLGTFAPLWEVFRVSSDKLALCHLELVKKLQDLLKEIARYGEEQGKAHKKSKEEVSGTLEAIQLLQSVAQLVPKCKEKLISKCLEAERLRRGGTNQKEIDKAERKSKKAAEALRRTVEKYNVARADFEQRMLDSAVRFQQLEEIHLCHMKGLISSYSHSVEDTHVQIGQVHEEFKQTWRTLASRRCCRDSPRAGALGTRGRVRDVRGRSLCSGLRGGACTVAHGRGGTSLARFAWGLGRACSPWAQGRWPMSLPG